MNKVYAHVLDSDHSRRGSLARLLFDNGIHAEIYEGIEEYKEARVVSGLVIAEHDTLVQAHRECELQSFIVRASVPVSLYSESVDLARAVRAMLSGAINYLSWPIHPKKITEMVTNVNNLESITLREIKDRAFAIEEISKLTNREIEVLTLIVKGYCGKGVAKELGVSPRTVEIHRGNAFRKLNARSMADAVRIGLLAGLYHR